MSHSNSLPEILSGDVDLGLGLGLRPGSLPDPPSPLSPSSSLVFDSRIAGDLFTWSSIDLHPSSGVTDLEQAPSARGREALSARMSGMFGRISEKLRPKRSSMLRQGNDLACKLPPLAVEGSDGPPQLVNDSIPLGTSLRQQKMLYEKEIGEIQRRRQAECETRLFKKLGMFFSLYRLIHMRLDGLHFHIIFIDKFVFTANTNFVSSKLLLKLELQLLNKLLMFSPNAFDRYVCLVKYRIFVTVAHEFSS
jgi:hypothetical protein